LEGGGGLALRPLPSLPPPPAAPPPAALLLLALLLEEDEETCEAPLLPLAEANDAEDDEAALAADEEAAGLVLDFDRRPSATRWVPACR